MAEIQSQQTQDKHGGVKRCKKLSTRIDLTPMVDLGFLLITFFVFTTSLSRAMAMKLNLPDQHKPVNIQKLPVNKSLILVLSDDKVGYYAGDNPSTMKFTNYAPGGLRNIILQRQAEVNSIYHDKQQLMILIKPTGKSNYKNVVETLDEMRINNVESYMLLDATATETADCLK